MTIYEFRTSMTVAAASFSGVTHNIPGGILSQVYILSTTATTMFMANLQDSNGLTRKSWDFVEGELNDDKLRIPVTGNWTVNITNVSPSDTFTLVLAVQE